MWTPPVISRDEQLALRYAPCYPLATAAAFVGMSSSTLRTWVRGREYDTARGPRFFRAPIVSDGDGLLSFANLVEAHALLVFRRGHGIEMRKVRQAIDFVGRRLGIERPLIDARFKTDGVDLFIRNAWGETIAASDQGQRIVAGFERLLERVSYDEWNIADGLLPLSRRPIDIQSAQPDFVAIDPMISGGLPIIRGAGVTTRLILQRFTAGETTDELAEDYGVGSAEIEEALRWEYATRSRAA